MPTQRTVEWTERTEKVVEYFQRQFTEPFRSTVSFAAWLKRLGCLSPATPCRVIDLGSGMGQALAYLGRQFPATAFTGIELNPQHVTSGNQILQQLGLTNVMLQPGDLFHLGAEHRGGYEGVLCMQTLSWLPEFRSPLEKMIELRPRWIALTSLFFDGPVNAKIEIQDYTARVGDRPWREEFYNVYSIPLVREFLATHGFQEFHSEPFRIDIDLPAPPPGEMGTYTVKLETGERLQLSGPLWLNWYFILARRTS